MFADVYGDPFWRLGCEGGAVVAEQQMDNVIANANLLQENMRGGGASLTQDLKE